MYVASTVFSATSFSHSAVPLTAAVASVNRRGVLPPFRSCRQVPFDAMSRVQFFETHQDQVPVMRFFSVISALLKCVHYDAFTIEDLLQPRESSAWSGAQAPRTSVVWAP